MILQVALKIADVGHLCAPAPIHKRWTAQLTEEFFCQGDREHSSRFPCELEADCSISMHACPTLRA